MHTPRLWTYLAVFDHEYMDRKLAIAYVKHMLEHSKCCPLDVALTVCNVDDPVDTDEEEMNGWESDHQPRLVYNQHMHLARIFKLLYANAARVRSLQVSGQVNSALSKEFAKKYSGHLEDIRELAAGFCSLPTPALEELCLVFQKGQDDTKLRKTTIDITLPVAPRLRRLRVDHVPALRRTPHSGLPVLEAMSMTSGDLPLVDIWHTIQLCPALLDFYLDVDECDVDYSDLPPLALPTVRSLTLKSLGLNVIPDYVADEELSLPKVTSLGVNAAYVYDAVMFDVKDQLTTCAILGGELSTRGLEILSQLAAVESVSITCSNSDIYAPLVQALQKDDPPVWPKMRNFELFLTCGFDDRGEALAGALKKRLELARAADPKVVPLERIAVNKEHRVANWVIAELGAHIGMNNVVVFDR